MENERLSHLFQNGGKKAEKNHPESIALSKGGYAHWDNQMPVDLILPISL